MSPSHVASVVLLAVSHAGAATLRVHYIRHGQSIWNAAQAEARLRGDSEAAVKALGHEEQFMDAPLSAEGVKQALTLRGRLFNGIGGGELGDLLRCAVSGGNCQPPLVLTSNLRRAIDTALLALRPALDVSGGGQKLLSMPALQETCHYRDCTPLPLREVVDDDVVPGVLHAPVIASLARSADEKSETPLLKMIVEMHGHALESAASASDAAFVRGAYRGAQFESAAAVSGSHLALLALYEQAAVDASTYHDERRLPDALKLRELSALPVDAFEKTARPLTDRLSTLLHKMLPATGAFPSDPEAEILPRPVVIAGHSRLLRELLYFFNVNRARAMAPRRVAEWHDWSLRSDGLSADCAALATDEMRLSNTGVVSFDLQVCVPSERGQCDEPTVTMSNCVLGAGSKVIPRTPPRAAEPQRALGWMGVGGVLLVLLLLLQLALIVRAVLRKKRQHAQTRATKKK